jgi:hypothetical protein
MPGAALPTEAMMGTTKNKTMNTPNTADITMNGDFCLSQATFHGLLYFVRGSF